MRPEQPLLPMELFTLEVDGDPSSKGRPRLSGARVHTPKQTKEAQAYWQAAILSVWRKPVDGEHAFGTRLRFYTASWQRRDIDNMVKLVWDACTGVVWQDDSQIVELEASVWRADSRPRTVLAVWHVDRPLFPTAACEVCGSPIRIYTSTASRRYCSLACRDAVARQRPTGVCAREGCGQPLTYGHTVYCSMACKVAATNVTVRCAWKACGKEIAKPQSLVRPGSLTFCSVACKTAYRLGQPRAWREVER